MSVPSVENFCFFPSLPPAQGGEALIRHRLPFLPLISTSWDISREWGLCVKVLVLTFQNVERDGTTGEQGLCKGETKELRGFEEYNGEPRN